MLTVLFSAVGCSVSVHVNQDQYSMSIALTLTTSVLQYYFDAAEAEAWMSEQELYMMAEDRAKDELGAQNMMKKHQTLENNVEDYADVVRQLGERSRRLIEEEHPEW